MKKLEKVANQLYKITGNLNYDYSELYYEYISEHNPYQKKNDINEFFKDSRNFLQALRYDENFDRYRTFVLKFDTLEICTKALLICQSHNLNCIDNDGDLTSNSTFDFDGKYYEITITTIMESAYNFIHGKGYGSFSIAMLSKILNTRILFSYNYGEEMSGDYIGVAENGEVHFNPTFIFNEWVSFDKFYDYAKQLFEFIDYVPDLENFIKSKTNITFE
jgi:hypothetical protein